MSEGEFSIDILAVFENATFPLRCRPSVRPTLVYSRGQFRILTRAIHNKSRNGVLDARRRALLLLLLLAIPGARECIMPKSPSPPPFRSPLLCFLPSVLPSPALERKS